MQKLLIHRQFLESWKELTEDEQASVRRLLGIMHTGVITPGMRPHMVGSFLSLSPNMDLRVIAIAIDNTLTLLHVGHHDAAYQWAKSRGLLLTGTGPAELVNLEALRQSLGLQPADEYRLPIPVQDVLKIRDDELFLQTISDMSPEWQEWLLEAYSNHEQRPPPPRSSLVFNINDDMHLSQALTLETPAWQLFLHPIQQEAADDLTSKSIAITGGPGTGKTVVLLNRILRHAPRGKDEDCYVLLTYSANLASYLYDRLKLATNRYFHVLPLYHLGGKLPEHAHEETAFLKYRLSIDDGRLTIQYRNEPRRFVRELLIDELQDAPAEAIDALTILISAGMTCTVLAADPYQSIHRKNRQMVESLIDSCTKHFDLTYCYRSSRQIIEKANEWLSSCDVDTSNRTIFALSGPRVKFIECQDLSQQVDATANIFRDLTNRYASDGLALIYCQYFNPSYKGHSKEEEALKTHPLLKEYYHFASTTKGKEYLAGILFISSSFLATDMGPEANRLRINTLYVALTRFRDEVTVVYQHGCTIEPNLRRMSSEHDNKKGNLEGNTQATDSEPQSCTE